MPLSHTQRHAGTSSCSKLVESSISEKRGRDNGGTKIEVSLSLSFTLSLFFFFFFFFFFFRFCDRNQGRKAVDECSFLFSLSSLPPHPSSPTSSTFCPAPCRMSLHKVRVCLIVVIGMPYAAATTTTTTTATELPSPELTRPDVPIPHPSVACRRMQHAIMHAPAAAAAAACSVSEEC